MLPKGTVLFTSRAGIGKTAILSAEGCTNQGFQSIVPHANDLDSYFIFSRTNELKKYGEIVGAGSTFVEVSGKQMAAMTLMMPPKFNEQKTIGDFFKRLDSLLTLHQRKYEKLLNIKKSMLEKMFPKEGEVVPEIRFKGFTGAWEQRKIGELSQIITGGTPNTSNSSYWEPGEIPWLSSGEVNKKRIFYTDRKISRDGLTNSSAKWVTSRSVLIALAGQGKTRGTVAINEIPLTTNQSIAAISFSQQVDVDFIYQNLEKRYEEIRTLSSGDGSRGGLNKNIIANITTPYTSLEEQKKIGAFLSSIDSIITLHQRKLEMLKNVKQAFLEKMFV